jgi:hypothetical protein
MPKIVSEQVRYGKNNKHPSTPPLPVPKNLPDQFLGSQSSNVILDLPLINLRHNVSQIAIHIVPIRSRDGQRHATQIRRNKLRRACAARIVIREIKRRVSSYVFKNSSRAVLDEALGREREAALLEAIFCLDPGWYETYYDPEHVDPFGCHCLSWVP